MLSVFAFISGINRNLTRVFASAFVWWFSLVCLGMGSVVYGVRLAFGPGAMHIVLGLLLFGIAESIRRGMVRAS